MGDTWGLEDGRYLEAEERRILGSWRMENSWELEDWVYLELEDGGYLETGELRILGGWRILGSCRTEETWRLEDEGYLEAARRRSGVDLHAGGWGILGG